MKLFLTILFVCIGISYAVVHFKHYPEKLKEATRNWHDTCLVHSSTTEEVIDGFRHGKFPQDPNLKKYIHCIFKYSKLLTREGELDLEVLQVYEPPQWKGRLVKELGGCFQKFKDEADMTERLYKTEKCLYDVDPENFGFP